MNSIYEAVLSAMAKGEKNNHLFGKGCSLFWRLALDNPSMLIRNSVMKKLTEFEESMHKRKKKPPSSSMLLNKTTMKVKPNRLTNKHGCQLSDNIVRYHDDPLQAITHLMKRLKKMTS